MGRLGVAGKPSFGEGGASLGHDARGLLTGGRDVACSSGHAVQGLR